MRITEEDGLTYLITKIIIKLINKSISFERKLTCVQVIHCFP
jgi:hypothetical protein